MSAMEMPARRHAAARDAAERRKKLLLVGLAAVLVALLAYEVPHLLNRSSSKKSASTPATTSLIPVAAAGASRPLLTASAPSRAQARALARLTPKDPFVPLIHESTSSSSTSSSTSSPASSSPSPTVSRPAPVKSIAVTPTKPKPAAVKPVPATPARALRAKPVALSAAVIWTNGRPQAVRMSQTFAMGDVAFRLVALGRKVIRIQVTGGSFAGGTHVIKVRKGHPVTLTNTATGVQYHLLFSRTK